MKKRVSKIIFTIIVLAILILPIKFVAGATSVYVSSNHQTQTSVSLSWTTTDDWMFQHYYVFYRELGTNSWVLATTITSGGTTSYTVTGLNPGTSYQFKIQDEDAFGTADSNTITISTDSPPPDEGLPGFEFWTFITAVVIVMGAINIKRRLTWRE